MASVVQFTPRRGGLGRDQGKCMKFADFHVGQIIKAGPYAVSEDEVRRFAEAYDPQWFHTDPKAAAHGRFGGLIASGWHTCAIAMRLAVDAAL